jgi:hypothetical protein
MSSKGLSLLSRPVLLFYTLEKLANILALVTFEEPYSKFAHGLTYQKWKPIMISRMGLFQIFHDCYSDNLSIYLMGHKFKLESIIDAGEINYIKLQNSMIEGSINANKTYDEAKKEVQLDELDREFIFTYALHTSTL